MKVTREMIGAAHDILLKKDMVLSADLLADIYMAMASRDAEIESLRQQVETTRKALVEAMGWNWLDCENDIPEEVIEQCYSAAKEER